MIITATEFWLLDALSEFNISLAQFCLSRDDYRLWRNELKPDVTDDAVQERLAAMIRAGWLRSHSEFGRRQVRSPLSGLGSSIVFGLTSAGGRVWEQIAEPRWHEYATLECLNSSATEKPESEELLLVHGWDVAALHSRLKEYVDMSGRTLRCVSPPRRLREWKPCYWKRVDGGLAMTATLSNDSTPRMPVAPKPWKKVGFTRNSCDRLVEAGETYSV